MGFFLSGINVNKMAVFLSFSFHSPPTMCLPSSLHSGRVMKENPKLLPSHGVCWILRCECDRLSATWCFLLAFWQDGLTVVSFLSFQRRMKLFSLSICCTLSSVTWWNEITQQNISRRWAELAKGNSWLYMWVGREAFEKRCPNFLGKHLKNSVFDQSAMDGVEELGTRGNTATSTFTQFWPDCVSRPDNGPTPMPPRL